MAISLTERLIEALDACPCCSSSPRETNTAEDGIPSGNVHETVFECGAAVFVTEDDRYETGRACPSALDSAVSDLQESVEQEHDEEADEP